MIFLGALGFGFSGLGFLLACTSVKSSNDRKSASPGWRKKRLIVGGLLGVLRHLRLRVVYRACLRDVAEGPGGSDHY